MSPRCSHCKASTWIDPLATDRNFIFERSSHDPASKQTDEQKKQRSAHLLCFAIRARISVYPCYVLSDNREREEGPNLYSLVALEVAEDGEKNAIIHTT